MVLVLLSATVGGVRGAEWLRQSSISPDGRQIAFGYKGDVYVVSAAGGEARRLTWDGSYDGWPVWSPSGERIAFSSERCGSLDVYVVDSRGGTPRRLTTHSLDERVLCFLDEEHILYASKGMPTVEFIGFPTGYNQVYCVDTAGGRPTLFCCVEMDAVAVRDGQLLYHDKKGYENEWRKHHRSPVTRDVWLTSADGEGRTFRQLTRSNAENRNPVWTQDGRGFYYLSEDNGTMNVFCCETMGGSARQVTHFEEHPVRYLSGSSEGTLCFSWDGGLYTMREGESPKRVDVRIVTDEGEAYKQPRVRADGAREMAVARSGKEIVVTVGDDLYATTTDYKTTRRLTNTPQGEASPTLSPDGRRLAYATDRGGEWEIYLRELGEGDELFTYAKGDTERLLLGGSEPYTAPQFSPDGKKLAYLANACEIRVYDFEREAWTKVLDEEHNFSYNDGDVRFEWSPDSRWIVSTSIADDGYFRPDVVVVSADGGEVHNLTGSGYNDMRAQWAVGGRAVVWLSDRAGYRSHGSWGSETDVYVAYLDEDAYRESRLGKEGREVYGAFNRKSSERGEEAVLSFEDVELRTERLTASSGNIRMFYLSPDGRKLYYVAGSGEGMQGGDLYVRDLESMTTTLLVAKVGMGACCADSAGENLYVCSMPEGRVSKIGLADGRVTPIEFAAETSETDAERRAYVFEHSVAQIRARFCDEGMHGVDFEKYVVHYREFLPSVGTTRDLAELISELLGELNCSHTGMVYKGRSQTQSTGELGAFYDESYAGDGLKIKEVLAGGPMDLASGRIEAGCVVKKIDGEAIKKGEDYYRLLAGKSGKWVLLTVEDEDGEAEVYVRATDYERITPLLYERWVRRRAAFTKEYSKGRVGYVHIEDMDSKSYRKAYSDILGKLRGCEALVVDERYNGGGWLHDDLALLLSGHRYATFSARGRDIGFEPFTRWTKKSCVLINEDCYSNAHGFPVTYRAFGAGKLVGTPIAGTMTAVWWERLLDGELSLGIPQLHILDNDGRPLENQQLDPDIEVYNTPEQLLSGDDNQLRRAIDLMLAGE